MAASKEDQMSESTFPYSTEDILLAYQVTGLLPVMDITYSDSYGPCGCPLAAIALVLGKNPINAARWGKLSIPFDMTMGFVDGFDGRDMGNHYVQSDEYNDGYVAGHQMYLAMGMPPRFRQLVRERHDA
jgi:hypothetical protein